MIKISIIVPVYNTAKYLENCLLSLVSQELDSIEVICIDDASTDNSYAILQEFSSKYSNIHIYHNDTNQGQGKTRNIGISKSRGKYIGFVDSDDFVSNKMYTRMYELAVKNGYPEVVSTGISFVKTDDVCRDISNLENGRLYSVSDVKEIINWQSPSACNKIFLRDSITNLRFLENTMWEDIAFTYSAIMNSNKILILNSSDYFYRRNIKEGVSSRGYQVNPNLSDIFRVCDFIEKNAREHQTFEIYKEQIRIIQFSSCIQRVEEISKWNISEEGKQDLMQQMIWKMIEKYGDLEQVDKDILSSRANLFLLESFSLSLEDKEREKRRSKGMLM